MNQLKLTLPLLAALASLPLHALATPLLGTDLTSFSVLAGTYATYGANTIIGGDVGGVTYVVGGDNSKSAADYLNTAKVISALSELSTAQSALNNLTPTTVLAATMSGAVTLTPGVYSASALTTAAGSTITLDGGGLDNPVWVFNIATYLSTGAATKVVIENAGANASVLWNTGGYTSLGADTNFVGSILASAYISEGAGANISCGNAYSASYISVPASVNLQSTNCAGTTTWAGSPGGLATGLQIVNGAAVGTVPLNSDPVSGDSAVPEPKTYTMLLTGLLLMAFLLYRRKFSSATGAK